MTPPQAYAALAEALGCFIAFLLTGEGLGVDRVLKLLNKGENEGTAGARRSITSGRSGFPGWGF